MRGSNCEAEGGTARLKEGLGEGLRDMTRKDMGGGKGEGQGLGG